MFGVIIIIASFVIFFLLIIGIHQKSTNAICISRKRLDGKTAVVTGGTAGMGLEIAKDLAHRGAKVIIACPFKAEGENAKKVIVQETENNNVIFEHLDLVSLDSIRKFAARVIKSESRLDILINNAGVGVGNNSTTSDGMHFIMQVNYYGTFLLTILLLPLLRKTGTKDEKARILVTASVLHRIGYINFNTINNTNQWSLGQVYGNSKLCLTLFTNELTKRIKNSYIVIHAVDPGAVGTNIFDAKNKVLGFILKTTFRFLFKTPWEGAQTALYAALDKKAGDVSGLYFMNCKASKAVKRAYCDKTAKQLWEESARLVNLTNEELDYCLKV